MPMRPAGASAQHRGYERVLLRIASAWLGLLRSLRSHVAETSVSGARAGGAALADTPTSPAGRVRILRQELPRADRGWNLEN